MEKTQFELLRQGLNEHYQNQQLTDFTITTTAGDIGCHRLALSFFFPYFEQLFRHNPGVATLDLSHLPAAGVKPCIDFAYSGKLVPTMETVEQIIEVGSCFQANVVVSTCDQFLAQSLDKSNAMFAYCMSTQYPLPLTKHNAKRQVLIFFPHLINSDHFVKLKYTALRDLIGRNGLNVTSEDIVVDALLLWFKLDEASRQSEAQRLINKYIRLRYCSEEYLSALLRDQKYKALATPRLSILIKLALRHKDGKRTSSRNGLSSVQQTPRYSFTSKKLLIIGGTALGDCIHTSNALSCMYWDRATVRWCKFTDLPPHYETCRTWSVCTGDGCLFVSGGRHVDHDVWTGCSKVYMWHNHKWTALPSLTLGRWDHGFTYTDNKLFCLGGKFQQGSNTRNSIIGGSMEYLDMKYLDQEDPARPSPTTWTKVAGYKLFSPRVCLLGGDIYIFGGFFDEGNLTGYTGKYDIRKQKWYSESPGCKKAAAPARFPPLAAIASGGCAFVLVATDREMRDGRVTMMKYTPSDNTWQKISPPSSVCATRRGIGTFSGIGHQSALALFDNVILLIGSAERSFHKFNIGANLWKSCTMSIPLPQCFWERKVAVFNEELDM